MAHETAMLLTQEEWEDVAHMVAHYRMCTVWIEGTAQRREAVRKSPENVADIERRRLVAQRIIDAAEV